MLKKIEKLIPAALDAIDTQLLKEHPKGIPSGYQSAISGFGTSILQMGLVPTLAVYLDADNKADIKREVLLETLFSILLSDHDNLSDAAQEIMKKRKTTGAFLKAISKNGSVKRELKTKLMNAALACKLAIRTYNLV